MKDKKITPACKVWLEADGKPFLGKGGAQILEAIKSEKSVTNAAKKLGMSYRYVWDYMDRMNTVLSEPTVKTHKGGRLGGGGANLTSLGEHLLQEYRRIEKHIIEVLSEETCQQI